MRSLVHVTPATCGPGAEIAGACAKQAMHYYTQEWQGHAHSRQFFMKKSHHGIYKQY